MADIPPIHASAAQAGFQSREAGSVRDARRNQQVQAARQQAQSQIDVTGMVDTTDADNQVFVDSEGAGSQGRAFDEPAEETPVTDAADKRTGITRDDHGDLHVDLDA